MTALEQLAQELALQKTYELQRNLAVLSELERRVNDGNPITST